MQFEFRLAVLSALTALLTIPADGADNFKKPSQAELKAKLSPLQYKVTQENDTETAFDNKYWDNHEAGIYVDLISGEPLYSSLDKYESKTGWPSFTKPLEKNSIKTKVDHGFLWNRTEVRSVKADSHLGHVFEDGPKPTGLRYCMNSAAMEFVPLAQMEARGYGKYSPLFAGVKVETNKEEEAILAGGCFWCMEPPYEGKNGIKEVVSGYSGGSKKNPSYEEVSNGETGHAEVVRIVFNPEVITYKEILDIFWKNIDPEAVNQQFCDLGNQYRSAIFYKDEKQKEIALTSRAQIKDSGKLKKEIATEIVAASAFYPAEEYHQNYYSKNPIRYKYYRGRCGRDARLKELWGK